VAVRLEATATAPSNIAFIKYWGNLDADRRLPFNDSLSMNLSAAYTRTRVRFLPGEGHDRVVLDGETRFGPSRDRVVEHLDRIRRRAGLRAAAVVESHNSFPMGTGIASSASGFAALTVAGCAAAGLDLTEAELSALARLGSGSAARSIPAGFVEWRAADTDEGSFASSIAAPDHWDLRDVVAIVSREHKRHGSTDGHAAALASAFFPARLGELRQRLPLVRRALLERDMSAFGPAVEAEALSLHAVAMTGRPPILYWEPATVALLGQVARWRRDGLAAYFTLDAGPNVHLLCEGSVADDLEAAALALDYVESTIANRAAGAAVLVGAGTEAAAPAGA
jgi:diphosphomevalonate decarboxylase